MWTFSCIEMAVTKKSVKKLEEMYAKINNEDLPFDTVSRETMLKVMDKILMLADWYFYTFCSDFNRARQIYEHNLLCYRIKNSKTNDEPASRNTVLSVLSGVWAFMNCLHDCPARLFSDSMFMHTIGMCSVFDFMNKKVDEKLECYYKLLGVSDGQPYTPKHYFFNDGTLSEKIKEFLALDVETLKRLANLDAEPPRCKASDLGRSEHKNKTQGLQ